MATQTQPSVINAVPDGSQGTDDHHTATATTTTTVSGNLNSPKDPNTHPPLNTEHNSKARFERLLEHEYKKLSLRKRKFKLDQQKLELIRQQIELDEAFLRRAAERMKGSDPSSHPVDGAAQPVKAEHSAEVAPTSEASGPAK